jgi:recombination protein RecA
MKIGVMFGNPETTPGGRALKFYTSVRLDIRRKARIKKGDDVVGSRTRVKVVKNKVASPFRQTEFDIMYGEGISRTGEILALGEKFDIIEKSGSWYNYEDETMGQGYKAARTWLDDNPDEREEILEKIRTAMDEEKLNKKGDTDNESDDTDSETDETEEDSDADEDDESEESDNDDADEAEDD